MEFLSGSSASRSILHDRSLDSVANKRRRMSETGHLESGSSSKSTKSRRVPENLRRRTEVSCDRCRLRKIRCVRPSNGVQDACSACLQSDHECIATLPRKQRIHISVDQLDMRYRMLDMIVRGMFPGRDLDNVEDLEQLAHTLGIDMTGLKNDESTHSPSPTPQLINVVARPEARPLLSSRALPSIPNDDGEIFTIPEGRLLPAPRGGFHYVGPASSIYFSMTIRQIVGKADLISLMATDVDLLRRLTTAAEFTNYPVSQALEARIQGHPATNATENTDDLPQEPYAPSQSGTHLDVPSPRAAFRNGSWRNLLPSRDISDRLVKAFFDRVHPNYTIFHRGNFHVKYESIWSPGDTAGNSSEWQSGWVCTFMMVLVLGALALEGRGLDGAAAIQQQYLVLVIREGLPRIALTTSIANVQTLMLLALYQHNAGERNTAWNLIGQAGRMAVALGLHRDGDTANFDPIERNTRRMVWWVLYMFEQNLSFILGRPSSTDLIDLTARLPDEDFTDGGDLPPRYFAQVVALTDLSIRVKRFTGSISVYWDDPEALARVSGTARQLNAQMDAWREALPPHLLPQSYFATERHRRAVLLLHTSYEHVRSILGRPFLLCRVNHEIDSRNKAVPPLPDAISLLAGFSVVAGKAAIDLLLVLANANLLDGQVWLDLMYVHHAIYLLCVPYLSRSPTDSAESQDHRKAVSEMISITQHMSVAPTFRLLLNLAMQIAYAVGMGPGDSDGATPDFLAVSNTAIPPPTEAELQQALALDQIFGPLPSPRDFFADLYDYGLEDISRGSPSWNWHFSNNPPF